MMKKIIFALLALFLLAGCVPAKRASVDGRRLPASLEIQLSPKNANVKVTTLPAENNAIRVRIHIFSYGRVKHALTHKVVASRQVGISLKKQGYVEAGLDIDSPSRDATATLIPFPMDPNRIKKFFEAAAKTYNLPTAYPVYLPPGYKLARAEYRDYIPRNSAPGLDPSRYGELNLRWTKGRSEFSMVFHSPNVPDDCGTPESLGKTITLSQGLSARSWTGGPWPGFSFFKQGKELAWKASGEGMAGRELTKIVKSVRLASFD